MDNIKSIQTSTGKIISYKILSNNCWECVNPKSGDTYAPILRDKSGNIYVNRYLYQLNYGFISPKQRLFQQCNTHNCINPDHYKINIGKKKEIVIDYNITESNCWELTSCSNASGNASIIINGKQLLIARYLYIQKYGEISDKSRLWRICKNKLCVNPDHQLLKKDTIEYTVNDNGCWFSKDREGNFPHLEQNGISKQINITLYEEKYGKIPEGMKLIRKCKQKGCCNPDHMELNHTGGYNKKELEWKEEYRVDYLDTPCWICTSHTTKYLGYAGIARNTKMTLAHRYMYEKYKGEIPKGLFICHHCDQRECINPDHLYAGTQTDNMLDFHRRHGKNSKGRNPLPEWMEK